MSAADDRVELIEKILANKVSKREVINSLNRLEAEYGEAAYSDDGFIPKEKPWNKNYFKKIERMSLTGVSSKKYILHLAEVRDYLRIKTVVLLSGSILVIFGIIGVIMYWLM